MPGGVAHPRSTKGVLNFTYLGNGASSVLVWLVSQPIESEHATTTRAMSGAPVVVVDGTAVDGTHPASPSDWLKTLPQLGAYTTGRTRGGVAFGYPCVPDFVHFGEIGHVGHPDHRLQDLGLVRADTRQKRVDLVEAALGLSRDAVAL